LPTVSVRYATIAAVVVGLAALHLPYRPRTFCLLRATTGIPCPFCGGTTALVHLGHADVRGAVAASPLAVLMAGVTPFAGMARRRMSIGNPVAVAVFGAVLLGSEIWQLVRFGLIGV
jgi:hypothetical protein